MNVSECDGVKVHVEIDFPIWAGVEGGGAGGEAEVEELMEVLGMD